MNRNEFGIRIHATAPGTVVAWLRTQVGETSVPLPPSPPEGPAPASSDTWGPAAGQELGSALFDTLFQEPGGRLLDEASERVRQSGENELLLRIGYDGEDVAAARWVDLPWELLYRKDSRRFLTHSEATPIVRSPVVAGRTKRCGLPRKLRVLILAVGLEDSRAVRERLLALRAGWNHDLFWTHCEALPANRHLRTSLERVLRRWDCHLLHWVWQGAVADDDTRVPEARGAAGPEPDSPRDFAQTLAQRRRLRLVIHQPLVAPDSGLEGRPSGGTLGVHLVRAGVPAVLDLGCGPRQQDEFLRALGQRLACGGSVEAATSSARLELYCRDPESVGWARPRLVARPVAVFRKPPEPRPWWTTLWTVSGVGLLLFSLLGLLRHRGVDSLLIMPVYRHVANEVAAMRTILGGLPLLFFQIAWTYRCQRGRREPGVRHRLPVAFQVPIGGRRLVATSYQYAFLFLFLLFPMATQLYLFGDSLKRYAFDAETNAIVAAGWEHLTHFVPLPEAVSRDYRHGRWDGWCNRPVCNSRFVPFWQPWCMLLAELLALGGLLFVLIDLWGLTPGEKAYGVWRRRGTFDFGARK